MFIVPLNPKQITAYLPSLQTNWFLRTLWSEGCSSPHFQRFACCHFKCSDLQAALLHSWPGILSHQASEGPPDFSLASWDRQQGLSSSWDSEFFHHLTQQKQVSLVICFGNNICSSSSLSQSEEQRMGLWQAIRNPTAPITKGGWHQCQLQDNCEGFIFLNDEWKRL